MKSKKNKPDRKEEEAFNYEKFEQEAISKLRAGKGLAAYNIKEAGLSEMVPEHAMALLEDGRMQSMVRNAWLTERWKEQKHIFCRMISILIILKNTCSTVYITRGDSRTENDPPWQADQLIGLADSYMRNNRQRIIIRRIPSEKEYKINRMLLWLWIKLRKVLLLNEDRLKS